MRHRLSQLTASPSQSAKPPQMMQRQLATQSQPRLLPQPNLRRLLCPKSPTLSMPASHRLLPRCRQSTHPHQSTHQHRRHHPTAGQW